MDKSTDDIGEDERRRRTELCGDVSSDMSTPCKIGEDEEECRCWYFTRQACAGTCLVGSVMKLMV